MLGVLGAYAYLAIPPVAIGELVLEVPMV